VRFELSFDPLAMDSGRWPLRIQLANDLYLADYFPELVDVAFQCNSGGDLTASTLTAPGSEHARLIWTYAGASSISCEYVMQTVDLQNDFSAFQLLLTYSDSSNVAGFDAMFSSTDASTYSIDALTVQCPESGTPSPSEAPSSTSDSTSGSIVQIASVGGCRYPLSTWTSARRYAAQWLTVAGYDAICGISYEDLAYVRGDARSLPDGFLSLAQQVVAVALNAAMYSVELAQINDSTVLEALDVVSRSINCADTRAYDGVVGQLGAWNNNTESCVGGSVNTNQHVGASSTCSKQRDAYLIAMIVLAVVLGIVLLLAFVAALYFLYRRLSGRFPQMALGGINDDMQEQFSAYSQQQQQQSSSGNAHYVPATYGGESTPLASSATDFSGFRA
jgi:hypothetical protein